MPNSYDQPSLPKEDNPVSLDPEIQISEAPEEPAADSFNPIQVVAKTPEELAMRLEQIKDSCVKQFGDWEIWRRPYEDTWNIIYRMYMSIQDIVKTPTRAKIFVPIVFQVIEAAIPKMMNVIFGQEEFFDVTPINPADEPQAKVIKLVLTKQLKDADFFMKFFDFAKQLLLYGTAYFKVYWKVTRKWVYERKPIREERTIMGFKLGSRITGWQETKEYRVVERRPEVDVLDILDVFPEPGAPNEKVATGVFIRSWINIDDLKAMGRGRFPIYKNTDAPELVAGDKNFDSSRMLRSTARGASPSSVADKSKIELIEFWGEYDLDNDGIKEEVQIVIANRQVLLRAMHNPFHHQQKPIIRSTLMPVPLEWFGMGLVEPVIPLVHELNTLRRQRLDNINLVINRMWKVLSYADIDLDTLVSSPNGFILTDDMAALETIQTENVTSSAYTEAAIVQGDIEQATAPKSLQGTNESGALGRTARGAQLIITQALEKFGTSAKMVEETAVKGILQMCHKLDLQFIDNDEMLHDPGLFGSVLDKGVTVEMLKADIQFELKGISDIVGKEAKINQLISYKATFADILSPESLETIAKKVYALMDFNPEDIHINAPVAAGMLPGQEPDLGVPNQLEQNGPGGPPAVSQK